MIIGIPTWENRVSPVLDTAHELTVIEARNGQEISRKRLTVPSVHTVGLAGYLAQSGIDTLICGALSFHLEQMLRVSGIEVYPWIKGDIDGILAAFMAGELEQDRYWLPGCRGGGRGHRRHGGPGRGRRGGGPRGRHGHV